MSLFVRQPALVAAVVVITVISIASPLPMDPFEVISGQGKFQYNYDLPFLGTGEGYDLDSSHLPAHWYSDTSFSFPPDSFEDPQATLMSSSSFGSNSVSSDADLHAVAPGSLVPSPTSGSEQLPDIVLHGPPGYERVSLAPRPHVQAASEVPVSQNNLHYETINAGTWMAQPTEPDNVATFRQMQPSHLVVPERPVLHVQSSTEPWRVKASNVGRRKSPRLAKSQGRPGKLAVDVSEPRKYRTTTTAISPKAVHSYAHRFDNFELRAKVQAVFFKGHFRFLPSDDEEVQALRRNQQFSQMSDLLVPSPRSDLGPILIRKHLTNNRGMSEHLQLYEQRHGIPLRGKDLASIWTLPQFQGVQLYNHQYRDKYTSYMIGMGYVEPQYKAEVMNHLTTLIETKGIETALRP